MGIKTTHWSFGLVIMLIAFFQFSNTLGHDFAWDDKIVIQENTRVQEGVSGIPDLLKKYNSDLRQDQYGYRPITLISFAIDYEFSGVEPGFYHFMNVLYFSLLCFVLFLVLKRIFPRSSPLLAFLITVLFTVHPIHTEVVANIKSRDEILALLFCLISLLNLIKFIDSKHWKNIVGTVVFFALAFLSKENAIVFLPVYALTLLKITDINWKRVLKIAGIVLPIGLLIVYVFTSYASNSQLGKEQTADLGIYQENFILGNAFFYTDQLINKIGNASYLVLLYLKDFIAPYNLAYYHGYGDLQPVGISSWQAILGLIVSLGAVVFAIFRFKKHPKIAYGIFFFFFSISIYLHVIRTLSDTRADRFAFFASIGLCIILIVVVSKLLKVDFTIDKKEKRSLSKTIGQLNLSQKVTFLLIFALFSIITFSRNSVWENDFTLVENDMERLETSARPHYFYATNLLQDIQQNGPSFDKEEQMIHHYERSIELSDSIYYARIELGTYLLGQGKINEGSQVFEEAVRLFPRVSDPRHYLGQAYVQSEQYAKAIPHLEKSIEFAAKSLDSYYLLAVSYGKTGQFEKGIQLAEQGLEKFAQGQMSMYEALGHVYFDKNDLKSSTENTLKMIEYGGDPYTVYATIIGRYQEKGDNENAERYYRSAIQQGIMTPQ
ncbi:MAG: glycosyltransferase family 39 protein [Crocinitomicaceae bacterium]|nr:glycosyltransferase family 39 protein [Crocinitomicaceae bacterium]